MRYAVATASPKVTEAASGGLARLQIFPYQRPRSCIISTTTTGLLGLPLSVSTTTVTSRMFELCGLAGPNELGPGVLLSDTAHRLAHPNAMTAQSLPVKLGRRKQRRKSLLGPFCITPRP